MNCVVPWNFSVSWNWFQFEIRKHKWRNKYFNLATNFGTLKKVTRKIENRKLKMNFFAYNRGTKQSDIEWYRPVIDHHMNFCERDRSLCKQNITDGNVNKIQITNLRDRRKWFIISSSIPVVYSNKNEHHSRQFSISASIVSRTKKKKKNLAKLFRAARYVHSCLLLLLISIWNSC